MRHSHQTPHELPYENHMLHQQLHDDGLHSLQQHHQQQHYYTLTNDTNLQQQPMYNTNQNQSHHLGNISTTGATPLSQHTHFDEVKGSSTWHSGGSGSSASHQLPYIDQGFGPPPPSQTQQHQVVTGTQNSHSNHNHFPQQNLAYDYIHSAPSSAPTQPSPTPPLHQYRTHNQQDAHLAEGTGYPSQPSGGGHVPNFESNLRFATDHFAAALNFNAPYSEGGSGGLFGGLMMGGANASGGGGNPTGATAAPGVVGEEEVRQQSVSSDSQAFYGNETMVKELRPEFVRWFYRYEQDRKWKPFTGYDSIRIESKYREVYRENIVSYSHNSYYPVASSNDESTDFSKFVQMQHNLQPQQQHHQHLHQLPPQPPPHHVLPPNNNNNTVNMTSMSNQSTPSRFSDMMQHKWWPGKGGETTVDTEFNNGGIGFPSSLRNNSIGATGYLPSAIKGRVAAVGNNKEKMLQKANSASALLGNNGNYANHVSGTTPTAPINPDMTKVIIVREGLYEVDLESWTCFSTYWPGDVCIITRGTWFYDGTWDALPVDQAEKLEEGHMGKFCGASLINIQTVVGQTEEDKKTGGTTAAPAIHRVSFNDFHVDWTSPTDIHWYSTATSHKFMRSVGQKLGFSDWGHRICRGYYKPASIVDRPSEIGHIVFVIHGIGHKMDTGRIVRNCSAFRDCVATMKDKYFPQLNNAKQRAEFFPVEWRSAAKLDGDIVEAITPQKLLTLRQLLNSTAMDIMYYTSPLYRAEVSFEFIHLND
ncbi:unnamed protein product [Orchesella dallaii]|uniref:Phospholipase DDHD1 n=1 Tax=Orchesella dallaii TaxID=48710 RepID=A0ABP1QHE8_9HEXA